MKQALTIETVRRAFLCWLTLCLPIAGCGETRPVDRARANLASMLRDSLGESTDPKVDFIAHGSDRDRDLYVHFDTSAFANMADSAFNRRALKIAQFAMRHYALVDGLDSVTVAARDNDAFIHHTRTFSIAQLREATAP